MERSLITLPPEILLCIVDGLIPEVPSLEERDGTLAQKDQDPDRCWFGRKTWPRGAYVSEVAFLYRTLSNLSLTCRGLKEVSTSALYHNILIRDSRQLQRLFITLIRDPERASLASHLAFLHGNPDFTLVGSNAWDRFDEISDVVKLPQLPPRAVSVLTLTGFVRFTLSNKSVFVKPADVNSAAANTIAILCHQAGSLLLRLPLLGSWPWTRTRGPVPNLCHFDDVESDRDSVQYPSITTLRLKADCNLDNGWDDRQLCVSLGSFPSMENLELCLDRSNLIFDDNDDLSGIKNLQLTHAVASLDFIGDLVGRCTRLKSLSISCVRFYGEHIVESTEENLLDEALRRTPELKALHLQFAQPWRGIHYGGIRNGERALDDVKLGSLRHLVKLESLRIEAMSLWGSIPAFLETSSPALQDLLPRSLERLELSEIWFRSSPFPLKEILECYACLPGMFEDLARHRDDKVPKLREIIFQCTPNPCDNSSEFKTFIKRSREVLQGAGIDFTVEYP
ncbi:hypothetical protein F4778DRAFT_760004 [Xylariomycetidae sp. FL2044]|nr:hypothetical protein F4778DRAFT_760004 [Xylariomycetidae sp. FL2044]